MAGMLMRCVHGKPNAALATRFIVLFFVDVRAVASVRTNQSKRITCMQFSDAAALREHRRRAEGTVAVLTSATARLDATVRLVAPPAAWPRAGTVVYADVVMSYRVGLEPVLRGVSFAARDREKIGVVGRCAGQDVCLCHVGLSCLFGDGRSRSSLSHLSVILVSRGLRRPHVP